MLLCSQISAMNENEIIVNEKSGGHAMKIKPSL